jgi:hypothetical protein
MIVHICDLAASDPMCRSQKERQGCQVTGAPQVLACRRLWGWHPILAASLRLYPLTSTQELEYKSPDTERGMQSRQ